MDSKSRRVAVLQKEADQLIAEAGKLRDRKDDPSARTRLKDIATRLQVVESEYSALLSAQPLAVTGNDEVGILRAENAELRRRNGDLERQISCLQRGHQEVKDKLLQMSSQISQQKALEERFRKLEAELVDLRNVEAAFAARETDLKRRLCSAEAQFSNLAREKLAELRSEAAPIEARLENAERPLDDLRQNPQLADDANHIEELRKIGGHVSEAKRLMREARGDVGEQKDGGTENILALQEWATAELERLKKQLSA